MLAHLALAVIPLIACFVSAAALTPIPTGASIASDGSATISHKQFNRVLKAVVEGESVDYLTLRTEHWAALNVYLDEMAAIEVDRLPRADQLAYYINLYNATMLKVVAERHTETYRVSDDEFKVFEEPLVRLKSGRVSLNHLENKIIRPQFNDARIHAAVNCAAASCPPLRAEAYLGNKLDQQLDEQMRAFVNDRSRNPISRDGKTIRVSKIFEWYAVDFDGKSGILEYMQRFSSRSLRALKLDFAEYSWALNTAPLPAGEWVALRESVSTSGILGNTVTALGPGVVVKVVTRSPSGVEVRLPFSDETVTLPERVLKSLK